MDTQDKPKKDFFEMFLTQCKMRVVQNSGAKGLILTPNNESKFRWIVGYFSKKVDFKDDGIDRTKGILMIGPVGCFKTTTMNIMQQGLRREHKFSMVSTAKVVSEYNRTDKDSRGSSYGGENALNIYKQPKEYCFDDLGEENEGRFFGSKMNVMKELILVRYELWVNFGIRTHFTTNISLEDLEKQYGKRAYTRLEQMSNVVALPKGTGYRAQSKPIVNRQNAIKNNSPKTDPEVQENETPLSEDQKQAILNEVKNKMVRMASASKRGSGRHVKMRDIAINQESNEEK